MVQPVHPQICQYLGGDPLVIIEELRELGSQRAKAAAKVSVLEHRRKTLLAELQLYRYSEGKCTGDQATAYAHAHPQYLEFLDGMEASVAEHGDLDSRYWVLKARLDFQMKSLDFVRAETYALGKQQ